MTAGVFFLALLSFSVLMFIGFFAVSLFWPDGVSRGLKWAFAAPVGSALCSFIFVLFRRPMFTVEAVVLAVLAGLYIRRRRTNQTLYRPAFPAISPAVVLLSIALGIAISQCMIIIDRAPHGDWDATAIWNSHSRYLYRDGPGWQTHIRNTFHPDYPLLVPALVARLWRYIGTDIADAASVSAALFLFAGIAVLAGIIAEIRSSGIAATLTLVLIGTPFYVHYGVAQSADVPLSLYVLSTVALICLYHTKLPQNFGLIVLAGFTAASAGWVKNEGLLFLLIMSVIVLAAGLKDRSSMVRRFLAFGAGALLPLVVILWFKVTVAPPNDIVAQRHSAEILEKMANPERHSMIAQTFSRTFWTFGEWLVSPAILLIVFAVVWGVDRKMIRNSGWLQGVAGCLLIAAGYYTVYLVTPMDLEWHLNSSLPRLYLHLWPTVLMLVGLATVKQ